MNWLADNAIVLAAMGGLAIAGLIVGWLKTAQIRLLYGALALSLAVIAVLAFGWTYVSPREHVRQTLFATAEAIERDDVDAVLERFVPEAEPMRQAVRTALANFRVTEVDIKSNLEITLSESGRRATAEFNAVGVGSHREGWVEERRVPFFFVVYFVRDGDRWLIDSFEQQSAVRGFQRREAPQTTFP